MDLGLTRRELLICGGGAALVGIVASPSVLAKKAALVTPLARRIRLYNTHTGEFLDECYWQGGKYIPEALSKLNYFLRDHRSGNVCSMNPRLFDALRQIQGLLNYTKPLEVISGYRSPKTNACLRRSCRGVAKNSYHMKGMAVDVRFKNLSLRRAYKAACSLKVGGVGCYSANNFIHVDVRGFPVHW